MKHRYILSWESNTVLLRKENGIFRGVCISPAAWSTCIQADIYSRSQQNCTAATVQIIFPCAQFTVPSSGGKHGVSVLSVSPVLGTVLWWVTPLLSKCCPQLNQLPLDWCGSRSSLDKINFILLCKPASPVEITKSCHDASAPLPGTVMQGKTPWGQIHEADVHSRWWSSEEAG